MRFRDNEFSGITLIHNENRSKFLRELEAFMDDEFITIIDLQFGVYADMGHPVFNALVLWRREA